MPFSPRTPAPASWRAATVPLQPCPARQRTCVTSLRRHRGNGFRSPRTVLAGTTGWRSFFPYAVGVKTPRLSPHLLHPYAPTPPAPLRPHTSTPSPVPGSLQPSQRPLPLSGVHERAPHLPWRSTASDVSILLHVQRHLCAPGRGHCSASRTASHPPGHCRGLFERARLARCTRLAYLQQCGARGSEERLKTP